MHLHLFLYTQITSADKSPVRQKKYFMSAELVKSLERDHCKNRESDRNPKGISNSLESQEKFLLSPIPFLFVFPKGVKKWYPLEFGTGFDY